jgi:hypothetical protein
MSYTEPTFCPDCHEPTSLCQCAEPIAQPSYDALTAENAALRKDAERYRWLRTQHANIMLGPVHVAGIGALTSTGLDAAIDAAMEQSHDK